MITQNNWHSTKKQHTNQTIEFLPKRFEYYNVKKFTNIQIPEKAHKIFNY